jgi:hypothetical protein
MAHCKLAPNSFTRGVGKISTRVSVANHASNITSDAPARFSAIENYRAEKRKSQSGPKRLHSRFEKSRARATGRYASPPRSKKGHGKSIRRLAMTFILKRDRHAGPTPPVRDCFNSIGRRTWFS